MPQFIRGVMQKDLLGTLDPDITRVDVVKEYGELRLCLDDDTNELFFDEESLLTLLEFLRRNK